MSADELYKKAEKRCEESRVSARRISAIAVLQNVLSCHVCYLPCSLTITLTRWKPDIDGAATLFEQAGARILLNAVVCKCGVHAGAERGRSAASQALRTVPKEKRTERLSASRKSASAMRSLGSEIPLHHALL